MKKLYILALSLLSVVASQAQSIKLYDAAGNEINDGDVVYVTTHDDVNTEEDEDNPGNWWYYFEGGISFTGDKSGSMTVKGEVIDVDMEGFDEEYLSYQICPFTSCFSFENRKITVVDNYTATDKKTDMQIHLSTGNKTAKDLVMFVQTKFTIYYTDDTSTVRNFQLVFDYDYQNPNAVKDITVDANNAPVEYFNLQGARVNNPVAGQLLIKRQGNKATKVIIK